MQIELNVNYTGNVPEDIAEEIKENFPRGKESIEKDIAEEINADYLDGLENIKGSVAVTLRDNPKPTKYKASVDVDYISGHLRYGHYEATFTEAQLAEFNSLTDIAEKKEYLLELSELKVDDFEVYDTGDVDLDSVQIWEA